MRAEGLRTRRATRRTNIEFSLVGKMLEMLKEVAPAIVRAAVIFSTNAPTFSAGATCPLISAMPPIAT